MATRFITLKKSDGSGFVFIDKDSVESIAPQFDGDEFTHSRVTTKSGDHWNVEEVFEQIESAMDSETGVPKTLVEIFG